MRVVRTAVLTLPRQRERQSAFGRWWVRFPLPKGVPAPQFRFGVDGPTHAAGCSRSHVDLLTEFAAEAGDGSDWMLVMEDDARWGPELVRVWPRIAAAVPADADLVYLGGALKEGGAVEPITDRLARVRGIFRTHAYLVRRSSAAKVATVIGERPRDHCDVVVSEASEADRLTIAAARPFLFAQRTGDHWYAWNPDEPTVSDADLEDYCRNRLGVPAAEVKRRASLKRSLLVAKTDCDHLGSELSRQCGTTVHVCGLHGVKTSRSAPCVDAKRWCGRCDDHTALRPAKPAAPSHFNASIAQFGGPLLLASRVGWANARVHLSRLDADLKPAGASVPIELNHTLCKDGQEDPRWFAFRGKPHLSFTGVERSTPVRTHQMVAELDDRLQPVNVWAPSYTGRRPVEKNWVFFEADGDLYSVYSISPEHVVLRHRGTTAEEVSRVAWNPVWGGHGHLRGGASPVRVGDEYYHFFHGMTWDRGLKRKLYTLGVYTFDAGPPFTPRRGPALLLAPDVADRATSGGTAGVVFPCGAMLRGDEWLVSYGLHDAGYEIGRWPRKEIERALNTAANGIPAAISPAVSRALQLPGWCSGEKAAAAVEIVLRERPAVCVEVGVFGGRWTCAVAAALRHAGRGVVHAIDPWDVSETVGGTHAPEYLAWWRSVDLPGVRDMFLAAVESEGLSPWVRVRQQSSAAAVWAFDRHSIDLLHIDGNHSAEVSQQDVRDWLPRVKPGGLIAFDDSHWPSVAGALRLLGAAGELVRDYGSWRLYRVRGEK